MEARENEGIVEAKASPTKVFFISMLTRDIGLSDCVLDLLDNSVDGLRERELRNMHQSDAEISYKGAPVEIEFDETSFRIADKSGGIPLKVATEYAFRFGRPTDAPDPVDGAIGLYGIGMKRAMFKMGRRIALTSSTGEESFKLDLDVIAWSTSQKGDEDGRHADWTFELHDVVTDGTSVPAGTTIEVTELYLPISRDLKNPQFGKDLVRMISRDYAFILARGLEVKINGNRVTGTLPTLRESDELKSFRSVEELDGVRIEIQAGLANSPPDDISASARYPEADIYGWYLVCNDRVVVTADKTRLTGWGVRPVPSWHQQFNGFLGIVRFESNDLKKLPWKTTKRDVETSNSAYQAALPKMITSAKQFVEYTNKRKLDRKRARKVESSANRVPVTGHISFETQSLFQTPELQGSGDVAIEFSKPRVEVERLGQALGIVGDSPSEVGRRAFEYCYEREVTE